MDSCGVLLGSFWVICGPIMSYLVKNEKCTFKKGFRWVLRGLLGSGGVWWGLMGSGGVMWVHVGSGGAIIGQLRIVALFT